MKTVAPAGLLFTVPALAAIGAFFAVPVLAALALSFTDFDLYGIAHPETVRFVGLGNYAALLESPRFRVALANTILFAALAAPLSVAVALGAALLLAAPLVRFRAAFRTALFVPVVTTLVAVAVVWRFLYHPRVGLLGRALSAFGVEPIDWLGDPQLALPALVAMSVWKGFGFHMVILVAGLQAIPERLYEAARIDGAGAVARFRHVTLPGLAPTLLLVSLLAAIGAFQLFAEPYVMTQGGPADATLSLVLLMYEEGFRYWNLGFASAVAFVLFGILVAGSGLQLLLARRRSGPARGGRRPA